MSKLVKPLTDAKAKNAKLREKLYALVDGGVMYIEVMPTSKEIIAHGLPSSERQEQSTHIRLLPRSITSCSQSEVHDGTQVESG